MLQLTDLWLPILLAAVAVWMYSAIAWMALPHHRNDHKALPDEAGFKAALRQLNIRPGVYGFPDFKSCKNKSPEEKAAMMKEPMGLLYMWGPFNMARNMILTFLVFLVVSCLIGYIGSVTIVPNASFGRVMQVLGTAGILSYSFAFLPNAIWFQGSRNAIISNIFDGVMQGLITGAVFAAMWPKLALPGT
jgi:hypothetical protein